MAKSNESNSQVHAHLVGLSLRTRGGSVMSRARVMLHDVRLRALVGLSSRSASGGRRARVRGLAAFAGQCGAGGADAEAARADIHAQSREVAEDLVGRRVRANAVLVFDRLARVEANPLLLGLLLLLFLVSLLSLRFLLLRSFRSLLFLY